MANFFGEERYTCECRSILFKEEHNFILMKDDAGTCSKVPYEKVIKCSSCGKIQTTVKIKGE